MFIGQPLKISRRQHAFGCAVGAQKENCLSHFLPISMTAERTPTLTLRGEGREESGCRQKINQPGCGAAGQGPDHAEVEAKGSNKRADGNQQSRPIEA